MGGKCQTLFPRFRVWISEETVENGSTPRWKWNMYPHGCVYMYIYIYENKPQLYIGKYILYIYILILKLQLLSINILSTCINGVCCFNLPVPPAKTPHGKGPTWECCCSRCGPARLAPPPPRRNGMSTMGAPLQRFTKGSHRNIIYIHGAFSTSGWMINDKNSANWNRLK